MAVKEFMTLYIYKEIFVDGYYDLSLASGPAPFIIDVGANTGLFIIRMKQLYPNSRVAGYEPLPSNFLQLKRSIELSRLDHVDIFMQGVGGTPRIEKLYIHPKNIGGHVLVQRQLEKVRVAANEWVLFWLRLVLRVSLAWRSFWSRAAKMASSLPASLSAGVM